MTLYIDYAWTHPNAQAIYDAGYRGVMRYLSNDASKDLSVAEAKALHAAGLGIGLVWETTASRAKAGQAAGKADAAAANAKADALGFPKTCPIFYAVDYDAIVADITPYFVGIKAVTGRPVGVYGSYYVVKAIMGTYASYGWQTMAWSGGLRFTNAHLYQTLNHTWPIPGVANSAWDENVLLHPFPLWNPTTTKEWWDGMAIPAADLDAIALRVWQYQNNTVTSKDAYFHLVNASTKTIDVPALATAIAAALPDDTVVSDQQLQDALRTVFGSLDNQPSA